MSNYGMVCVPVSDQVIDFEEEAYNEAGPGSSLEIPLNLLMKCRNLEAARVLVASTPSIEDEEERDAEGELDDNPVQES